MAAVALVAALLVGIVVQHHHHDADGSPCIALCLHHDCPGHDCGDRHDHGGDPCDGDCSFHLDTFCCDGSHHHVGSGHDMQPVCDLVAVMLPVAAPEAAAPRFGRPEATLPCDPPGRHLARRGPPVC